MPAFNPRLTWFATREIQLLLDALDRSLEHLLPHRAETLRLRNELNDELRRREPHQPR